MTRARSAGFTLLEVLTAVAVLGMILLALREGIGIGLRAGAVEAGLTERSAGLEPADRLIRLLIERMDPGSYAEPPAVRGDAHALGFVTDLPGGGATPVHADVTLLASGGRLLLRWRPHPHVELFDAVPASREIVLFDHLAGADFAYAAPSGAGWESAWSARSLPGRVRLRLRFGGADRPPDRPPWPDIVAAPRRERPLE